MKISVLIAHLNEVHGLIPTVLSVSQELYRHGIDYEVIICDNGSGEVHKDTMEKWVRNGAVDGDPIKIPLKIVYEEKKGTVPPWQTAARAATGDVYLFMDQHTLLAYDFFDKQLPLLTEETPLVYAACNFYEWVYMGGVPTYQYNISKNNLITQYAMEKKSDEPYPVLCSQMGAALTTKENFDRIGGFGICYDLVGGYTAEELMLPVKTNMFGKKALMNPNTCYIHMTLPRGMDDHNRKKADSLCVAAYALGGKEYFDEVASYWRGRLAYTDEELIREATPEYEFLRDNAKIPFDKLL